MAGPSLSEQIKDLMAKLNPGTVFGLDIGSHSIKVCEVSGNLNKLKLERFGTYVLSEASLIEDEIQKPEEIVEAILEALTQAKIKSKLVCLGLFGPNTMTKRLSTPEGTKEEIEDHVLWESEQYITFGADESVIDYFILGENEGGGKDVIVAAAKNDTVESFLSVLKQAKLNAKFVDLNVLALSNIFEIAAGENLEEYSEGTLLIDVGAQTTKIVIYKNGGPIFTKEIPIGGSLITEEIQRQMGVSYEEAEDLKTTTDDNGNLPEEILAIVKNMLDQHVAEIRKNINFYVTQGSAEKVEYCFICGGGSLIPGFIDKLSEVSGIPIERLDLFSKIKVDGSKNNRDLEQLSAISAICLGLALRKFNS